MKKKARQKMSVAEKRRRLLSHCKEDGVCLVWTGTCSNTGGPVYAGQSARRPLWETTRPKLKPGELVTCTCKTPLCMFHLAKITRSEVIAKTWQRTDIRAKRVAGNQRDTRTRKHVIMSMEKAREIRCSDKSNAELAKIYGCHIDTIYKIRINKSWKESITPFSGLFKL